MRSSASCQAVSQREFWLSETDIEFIDDPNECTLDKSVLSQLEEVSCDWIGRKIVDAYVNAHDNLRLQLDDNTFLWVEDDRGTQVFCAEPS